MLFIVKSLRACSDSTKQMTPLKTFQELHLSLLFSSRPLLFSSHLFMKCRLTASGEVPILFTFPLLSCCGNCFFLLLPRDKDQNKTTTSLLKLQVTKKAANTPSHTLSESFSALKNSSEFKSRTMDQSQNSSEELNHCITESCWSVSYLKLLSRRLHCWLLKCTNRETWNSVFTK